MPLRVSPRRMMPSLLALLVPAAALAQAPTSGPAQPPTRPPGTEIWLAPIASGRVGTPRRLTDRPGYDNQPSFTSDGKAILYTAIGADGQADVWRIDLASARATRLTRTPESEYSPTVLPDGSGFSVVRVEADSAQRLWRFAPDGSAPRLVLPDVRPVGYHAWIDDTTVALFVLGAPATLRIAHLRGGTTDTVARDIGRALQWVPALRALGFVQRRADGSLWASLLDPATRAIRPLAPLLAGNEFCAWTPAGELLTARDGVVYAWRPAGDAAGGGRWDAIGRFDAPALRGLSRLAVSPDGAWLALVADEVR